MVSPRRAVGKADMPIVSRVADDNRANIIYASVHGFLYFLFSNDFQ